MDRTVASELDSYRNMYLDCTAAVALVTDAVISDDTDFNEAVTTALDTLDKMLNTLTEIKSEGILCFNEWEETLKWVDKTYEFVSKANDRNRKIAALEALSSASE